MNEGQGWGSRIPTVYQTDTIFNFRKASPGSPVDTLYQVGLDISAIQESSQSAGAGGSKGYQKLSYRGQSPLDQSIETTLESNQHLSQHPLILQSQNN